MILMWLPKGNKFNVQKIVSGDKFRAKSHFASNIWSYGLDVGHSLGVHCCLLAGTSVA